jgi:hypothetical protein
MAVKAAPALTIWYRQPLNVVYGSDPHVGVLKRYARLTGLPYRRLVVPRGTATRWQLEHFPTALRSWWSSRLAGLRPPQHDAAPLR